MKIAANMWIAVVDGGKGLVLVNQGTAVEPRLVVRRTYGIDNPPTHEQGRDQPPRAFDAGGTHRSAIEAPDLHQKAEDRFVQGFVRELQADAEASAFDRLVIVAPPVALGELRRHVGPALAARIVKEIAADYVKMPVSEITKAVARALAE
jgi:protein required for attachment to host cells